MHNSQLNRVLKLVRRTGDKLVIFDKENDSGYAVMNLDQYENLLDEANFNPSDFDSDDDEEFFAPRPSHGFEPISSVMKDRWHDEEFTAPTEEEKAPWENGWQEQELGEIKSNIKNQMSKINADDSESEVELVEEMAPIKEDAGEIVPLNDVPHDEEEETFLLEPVE
ncbi:MAG: hypothetical protein WCX97_04225 [Candidatus Magasanikbacteria bacterium]